MSPRITSGDLDVGPNVQTIFVRVILPPVSHDDPIGLSLYESATTRTDHFGRMRVVALGF
jgi:hypothetical protein